MLVGQSLFSGEDNQVIINTCAIVPKFAFLKVAPLLTHLGLIIYLTLIFVGLVIHAAIFFKRIQLEKQQSVKWVVKYEMGEVKLVKNNLDICNRKLWKHERNVVSPLGGFLSYVMNVVFIILCCITFYINNGHLSVPIVVQFLFFSIHSVIFFFLNFIETVCSQTLRGSLLYAIPRLICYNLPINVVNI